MTNEEMISEIRADVKLLLAQSNDHKHSLYGNGQPGLVSRVQAIEQRQADCPARMAYIEGRTVSAKQGWLSVLIAVASTALAVVALYK